MVTLDPRFVLDCAEEKPAALARLDRLRRELEPLYLSDPARAAVVASASAREAAFRRRVEEVLRATRALYLDPESVRCAGEIAQELAEGGRRLDGVDLFVAASARQLGQAVVSRNPSFGSVSGLVCQPY